jgi:hypothetical protein
VDTTASPGSSSDRSCSSSATTQKCPLNSLLGVNTYRGDASTSEEGTAGRMA